MMNKKPAIALVSLFILAAVIAQTQPAAAVVGDAMLSDADHWMYTGNNHTGVYQRRPDVAPLSGLDPGPCPNDPFRPTNSVYYPQRALITIEMAIWKDWIELGTGHGCVGQRYWYGAYVDNHMWVPVFVEWNIPLQTSFFDLHRLQDEVWRFEINGVRKYSLWWNTNARDVEVGIESQNPNAVTPWVMHDLVQKTMNDGPWQILNGLLWNGGLCAVQHTQNSFSERSASPC